MNTYLGIDLGTSGVKILLVDSCGKILAQTTEEYPVYCLKDGWSEQNPLDWVNAVKTGINRLFKNGKNDRLDVKGVSFGGQMHGLVLMDNQDRVIRPAILWNDGRTQKQTDYLNREIGKEKLSNLTANIAFAGFTAPKILWVKENEPENFNKIAKICLPKDYLAYMMTGKFSTDYSDAGGTLLLDVKNKRYSKEMCDICSVDRSWLAELYESYEVTGKIKNEFGLPNAFAVAGAGDNAAAAIGTGTVSNGDCNISLGTSGTVFISGDNFSVDDKNSLHAFPHATGKWHLMGSILSAASANKWWIEDVLNTDYDLAVDGIQEKMGENNVYFLPYLMGERSPHNDVNARGAFIGMRQNTSKEEMSLAVLEGVAFALKDCVEIAKENGVAISKATICGGGAKSIIWKEIIANVINAEICSLETEQGPAYGAAILAMVGVGEYESVQQATEKLVKITSTTKPNQELVKKYEQKYQIYKTLYPTLKKVFENISTDKN
ncbi:MAG: xylulokinase [Clostridia bacterium]|nr:xylulokinase [Clostridia bacterium]